jgi:N-glycosylase/DNA lyase
MLYSRTTRLARKHRSRPDRRSSHTPLGAPGVGRKIADCTLLFGAGRLEAFPIDTWVEKILTHSYQLEGWKLKQLQDFARIHFGGSSGYAQQYLFAAARAGLIKS